MNEKILFVDDHIEEMQPWMRLLGEHSYQILTASNGEEALTQIDSEHPDLIVCEFELPGMSGKEVLEQFSRRPDSENIPFIFVHPRWSMAEVLFRTSTGRTYDTHITKGETEPRKILALVSRFLGKDLIITGELRGPYPVEPGLEVYASDQGITMSDDEIVRCYSYLVKRMNEIVNVSSDFTFNVIPSPGKFGGWYPAIGLFTDNLGYTDEYLMDYALFDPFGLSELLGDYIKAYGIKELIEDSSGETLRWEDVMKKYGRS